MKKQSKEIIGEIKGIELLNSMRIPLATKTGKVFKSRKEYNRKDQRWKRDCLN